MRDANKATREYLDKIMIEERLIGAVEADTTFHLWGESFASPVMTPAFSHLKAMKEGRESALIEYARACREGNYVNWIGMGENDLIGEVLETGAKTVRIIKPYADKEKVYSQLKYAKEQGAFAVGMDIDHVFGMDGRYDVVAGEDMTGLSEEDLRSYIAYTDLPFIAKGVLSVTDALICAKLGARGIVVSHHHGRMPFAIPPLMVLPKIKEALREYPDVKIFVDCHMDTGADAFKALALGADAVSVGRAMLPSLEKDGVEGVKAFLKETSDELKTIMNFTGASNLDEISADVLWNLN